MPSFTKGGAAKTPFGKNVYLRSTRGMKFESYTCAMNSVPTETIDGVAGQRCLQPGTVLAKITSGPDAGKVGPFQAAGTAEIQTITPSGTWSGGTYTLSFNGATTAALAYNATNTTVQTALNNLATIGGVAGSVAVTGGPLSTGAFTITFGGSLGGDQPQISISTTNVTGTTPAAVAATTTPGVAGSVDGRSNTANLVGINETFLPWQFIERDVDVAALYDGTVVQGWCFELNAAGLRVPMSNTTRDALRNQVGIDILAK